MTESISFNMVSTSKVRKSKKKLDSVRIKGKPPCTVMISIKPVHDAASAFVVLGYFMLNAVNKNQVQAKTKEKDRFCQTHFICKGVCR